MKIAFVTYEYPSEIGKGGIGTYTSQMADMLVNEGCNVHVFAGTYEVPKTVIKKGIFIHLVKCINPNDFRINVLPVFEKEHSNGNFDLIESAEIHGNALEIKRALPQIPLVVRLHAPNWLVEHLKKRYTPLGSKLRFFLGALRRGKWDLGYWRKHDHLKDLDFQFTLLANAISSPSQIMKNWVVENWNLPPHKIEIIPNLFIAPHSLLQLPITKNSNKKIIFFGRLNVLKGLVNATIAIKKILKEFPEYQFKVIGDDGPGPYGKLSMKEWMQHQLKDEINRVSFLDGLKYNELPDAIAEAEIIILPSLFESFSYTCAEAMAGGKAVVGSLYTGMSDIIENNKTGVLVNAESISDIYKAIKMLIINNDFRYDIALNARDSISKKFSHQNLSHQYMEFYKSVLRQNEQN